MAPDHDPDETIRAGRAEDERDQQAGAAAPDEQPAADDWPTGEPSDDAAAADAAPVEQAPADAGWADVDAPTTWEDTEETAAEPVVPAARSAAARGPARRPPGRRPGPPRGRARPQPGAPTARPRKAPPRRRPAPPPRRAGPDRRGTIVLLTVLTLVVVALGVGGIALSRNAKKKSSAAPTTQPTTTLFTLPDNAFVTFRDPETGFTIRYPRGWQRSEAPLREIRLQVSDGKQYACRVQVRHTDEATTPANLGNLQQTMLGFIGSGVQIVKQDAFNVNGLIGFRFIYTFTDAPSGLEGAHEHYFLFQGHKMNSIVFEVLPSTDIAKIEGVFDQMVQSFHSDPEPDNGTGAATTTTTG